VSLALLRRAKGKTLSIAVYRGFLTLAVLTVGFENFPEHRTFVALCVVAFSQGVAALGIAGAQVALGQNHLDDMAERKTRHTILLAQTEWNGHDGFWNEVDRRVAAEADSGDEDVPWWGRTSMFFLQIAGYLASDLITVGLALIFAG
jgi:hypothetical protein